MSRLFLLLSIFFVVVIGCGLPPSSVSGTVTFNGHPLRSGTVLFHGADGRIEHGLITEEGKYVIANAPSGEVRITVKSHAAKPAGLPSRGGPPPASPPGVAPAVGEKPDGKFVSIPPRYLEPAESGLRYTIISGPQTHNIQLVP